MIWKSNLRLCVTVSIFVLLLQLPSANAQVAGGTISGTVTDIAGRVISGVRIVIQNVDTSVSREVTTNEVGFYYAQNLFP